MASVENVLLRTAEGCISRLSQPELSGLAGFRRQPTLPPLDKVIDPQRGRYLVHFYLTKVVPQQWDTFADAYRNNADTDTLMSYLSSANVYAQLARVLASEMIIPGFEDAVVMTALMLDYHLEEIATPVRPDEFRTPYEGYVVPFFDVAGAIDALPEESSSHFDNVLIRTTRLMAGLCIERNVSFD